MNDPIEDVLNQLRHKPSVQRMRFTSSFLNNVGQVLEREGFATTRLYLQDKKGQSSTREQARLLLEEVLPIIEACKRIKQDRAIGRYIIKALPALQERSIRR